MDPGWPANPPNSLICILCKSAVPYNDRNPERFFRHLLADHFTFFNLNFLLEFSLMQPHATIWENNWPVSGRVQNVAETVLDQVQALPVKKEMKARSSNLVEADSTSNKDQLTSQLLLDTSSCEDNKPGNISLEESCQPQQAGSISTGTTMKQSSFPIKSQPKTIACSNLQIPVKAQSNPSLSYSDQLAHEDLNNNILIKQIPQPDLEPQPTSQPLGTPFSRTKSNPRPFLFQSRALNLDNMKPYNPTTVEPDFSALDLISFVKQKPRLKRKVTRSATVNKNYQPVPCLPDKPNRHLVPEDLQMLIYHQNPSRRIKYAYGQMLMDDYVLKKKKGPYLMRGGRVVNWCCINSNCQYTALTWEGQIQDTARLHNHPSQAELYAKKQVEAKMRVNMALEISTVVEDEKVNPVIKAVMDVVTVTDINSEMKDLTKNIDALKQEVGQHKLEDSQQGLQLNMFLDSIGDESGNSKSSNEELSPWRKPSTDAFKDAFCHLKFEMEIAGQTLKKTFNTLMSNSVEKSMYNFSTHVSHSIEDLEFKSNGIVLSGEELAGSIDRGLIKVSLRSIDEEEVHDLEVPTSKDPSMQVLIQDCQLVAFVETLEAPDAENILVNDWDVDTEHVLQFYKF